MAMIPLIDLRAQYRSIQPHIDAAVRRVLTRGQFILGSEVEGVERELAAYCGTRYAVAVASGTDALELALRACRIGPGDEVITSAFTYFATAEAILGVGATPVFADIEPETFTLDPSSVSARLTRRTKALLPVHLYGHPCDMDALLRLARAHQLKVVEDCAQALGATIRGRRVGSFGDAGCFSFYPSKNLGAYGDGGMVVTNTASVAKQIGLLRAHGERRRYDHVAVGTNSRLDELQAAVLRVKLRRLEAWNAARRRHAATYAKVFHGYGLDGVRVPMEHRDARHVYALYTVRVPRRRRVETALARRGIASQVAYPTTLPRQPALTSLPSTRGARRYPEAERASRDVLSLPMYPELTRAQIRRIVATIADAVDRSPR